MKRAISAVAVVMGMLMVGSAVVTARAQSGFEPSPVLRAKDLAAPELLRGPQFVVSERVPVKDFLCRFTLRSDYGTFDVHGLRMLQIRVREVYGLAQLNQVSNTQEFLQAAAQAVARPVTSAVNMITNPVETVEGLPGGVTRLFDRIKLGGEEIAAAATAPGGPTSRRRRRSRSGWAASRWTCSASRRSGGSSPRASGWTPTPPTPCSPRS